MVREAVEAIAAYYGIDPTVPFGKLPKKQRDLVLFGPAAAARASAAPASQATRTRGDAEATASEEDRPDPFGRDFEGVIPNLRRRFEEGSWVGAGGARAVSARCANAPPAAGDRLRPESRVGQSEGQDDRRVRQPAGGQGARRVRRARAHRSRAADRRRAS